MRISWITFAPAHRTDDGRLTSALASLRYRVLAPIGQLPQHDHRIVTAPQGGPLEALEADLVIFSKSFAPANEALAVEAKSRGVRVIFDVCDHHFEHPQYGPHYRAMAGLADRVVCNTQTMAEVAAPHAGRAPVVVEDPYEGPPGAAAYAPGETLRLLWFGHPTNFDSLQDGLAELVGRPQPTQLAVLTQLSAPLGAVLRAAGEQTGGRLAITAKPWSLAAQWAELAACDAVIIPSRQDPRKAVKSANRMVEALRAGRPVAAQPMPAYAPFDRWTPVRPTLAEGLDWLAAHADRVPALVTEAQAYIEARCAPTVVAEGWRRVIEEPDR